MSERTVEFGCGQCGRAVEASPGEPALCARCGAATPLPQAGDGLSGCLACACPELYRHRDFNQKLGIAVIAAGAVACIVLHSFLPLLVAAAIDCLLYFTLPDVAICYRCKAHHRGFAGIAALPRFDLERHEHFRFVKAREEGRLPPRPSDPSDPSDPE
jgi:hypothetical protein